MTDADPNPRLLRSDLARSILAMLISQRAYESEGRIAQRFGNSDSSAPQGLTLHVIARNLHVDPEGNDSRFHEALDALIAYGYVRATTTRLSIVDNSPMSDVHFSVTLGGIDFQHRYGNAVFGGLKPFMERAVLGSTRSPFSFALRFIAGGGILGTAWGMHHFQLDDHSPVILFTVAGVVAIALALISAMAQLPAEHRERKAFDDERRRELRTNSIGPVVAPPQIQVQYLAPADPAPAVPDVTEPAPVQIEAKELVTAAEVKTSTAKPSVIPRPFDELLYPEPVIESVKSEPAKSESVVGPRAPEPQVIASASPQAKPAERPRGVRSLVQAYLSGR